MEGRSLEIEKIKKFALRLKKLRVEKGLSQEKLAAEAGITLSQVARIETARINPTLTTLAALSKALKVDLGDLFDHEV